MMSSTYNEPRRKRPPGAEQERHPKKQPTKVDSLPDELGKDRVLIVIR